MIKWRKVCTHEEPYKLDEHNNDFPAISSNTSQCSYCFNSTLETATTGSLDLDVNSDDVVSVVDADAGSASGMYLDGKS